MAINGRLLRLQAKNGAVYKNIEGEVSSVLSVSVGYVETAGADRGVGHKVQLKSWSIQCSLLIGDDLDNLEGLWDIFSTVGDAPWWRFDASTAQYRGQAYINSWSLGAGKDGLVQVDITLQGTGSLIKV